MMVRACWFSLRAIHDREASILLAWMFFECTRWRTPWGMA